MVELEKKELELRIIEVTRERCAFFPEGELAQFESPDWIIPTARVGIEVSQLLPERAEGAMFSPPQLSGFHKEIVSIAERNYRALPGARPVDVLVYFSNEWTRKSDANEMGSSLAQFVASNYPSDGRPVLFDEFATQGIAVVHIRPGEGGFHTAGFNTIEYLTYERLARR